MLKEKYHFPADQARQIAEFLLPMLDLIPEKRANAGGMSGCEWMQTTKGMEGVKLDVPVGSKGEGIEGWATEVKKR